MRRPINGFPGDSQQKTRFSCRSEPVIIILPHGLVVNRYLRCTHNAHKSTVFGRHFSQFVSPFYMYIGLLSLIVYDIMINIGFIEQIKCCE